MMETKPPLPTAQPLLEARRLTVTYRRRGRWLRAVRGVDLNVPKGRTLGLVGESGCGKTSLGRALLRLVPVAGGTIDFDGTDVRSLSSGGQGLRHFRKRAQMVFQDAAASLNPRMCVGAIVADPLAAHRWGDRSARRRRVADLLEMVGLDSSLVNRYPHELSGGQRQRVNIARALALEPEFIVCDEPISALDVAAQCEILDLLGTLRDALGLSMLFITHNLGVAERFCDDVAVMYLGSIIEIAPAKSLLFEARHPYTATLRDAVLPLKLDARFNQEQESVTGEALSPLDPTPGCAYQSRCPHASQRCRDEAPNLLVATPSSSVHSFACHHPLMPHGSVFGA